MSQLVVLYRFSTSNHNFIRLFASNDLLYYIVSLHQTTTEKEITEKIIRCIISFLYIKPQPCIIYVMHLLVVLYRFSTSNHNYACYFNTFLFVVLYRFSTSNHN